MPKRKNPSTSISAYRRIGEFVNSHHIKIIAALRLVSKGMMYEQIAAHTSLDKIQIGRRLSDLERMMDCNGNPAPLIYKTEEKRKTASGREAYVYKLTAAGEAYIIPDKDLPGKSISIHSKEIQAIQLSLLEP